MEQTIWVLFLLFFCLRLGTLAVSIRNEKRLNQNGAKEFGKRNSLAMAVLHVIFYLSAIFEAALRGVAFDGWSLTGVVLFICSYIVLLAVIFQLREIWTVKLYIAEDQKINKSFLFKYVRHPNYFLNIVPELIGIGLLCHAWYAMIILFPLYAVTVMVRVIQEEKIMKERFVDF
ncbi:MAG TPA: isoprenylcysteine carboxyl methyltransferase family protein [Bacillales bacterium]|nr:isoprenylcysteine carboxyl methyltransferase family protein [Bacillales bacterium]